MCVEQQSVWCYLGLHGERMSKEQPGVLMFRVRQAASRVVGWCKEGICTCVKQQCVCCKIGL